MNFVDYLFSDIKNYNKDFILGRTERASFKKIYNESMALSYWLQENYGVNNRILLTSPNSVFFVTVYLGILKSGNICVPINPTIEQNNLDYILQISDISVVFISSKIKSNFLFKNISAYNEDELNKILELKSSENIISTNDDFDKENIAEILFTSGSTGHPKGVKLSHKNLISNTDSILQYLNLNSDDIMEVVLPFHYCYGLSLLHTHFKCGASIVLNNNFIFLGSVLHDLKKYRCTGFAGVPSHFQILLRKSESFKKSDFPDLRYVTQAGGKLHDVFIKEFVSYFPEKKFFVMYGQTEATARLSYLSPDLVLNKIGSIGKAIPGVTLKIVDEKQQQVKKGEIGELIAKGDNIMMGYLDDTEGSKNTLKNGWLFTGDMAREDDDGFIFLYARKKEIIKVGGKRVSPKEIEQVIVKLPFVLSCKIKGVYDEISGEALKAEIVLTDGIEETVAHQRIVNECKKHLAIFKIPRIIEFEDRILDPLKLSKNI